MLTGLWYEFLWTFNHRMRIENRNVTLVTDNCPTHPHPRHPPQNYNGPTPPVLTNITLIYLPPNTTSRLQPLDQGIIKAFKSAYRRQYTDNMVQYFNNHGVAPEKINILQAVHLISSAWDEVTPQTIINCWRKADICGGSATQNTDLNCNSLLPQRPEDQVQYFVASQRTHCQIAMRRIFDPLSDFQVPDPKWAERFEEFFSFDEDAVQESTDSEIGGNALPSTSQLVKAGIVSGILLQDPSLLDQYDGMDNEESETASIQVEGNDIPAPLAVVTTEGAIHYASELSRYLQSLKTTELYSNGGKRLGVDDLVKQVCELKVALVRHKHTAYVHQTKINRYFTGALREYRENAAAGPSVVIRERALVEDNILLRHSISSSDVEEDEEPYLPSPVVWSGSGIDAEYERLAN
ncbi:uncharacterized protein H6S33_006589 [Morchella sextelata]|uniref:uncharacterized protein n=1 Tax=Morchella sextelata TaxID=1174677 RepID=UPI001D055605|nr:uncharacterized protein H6S33_006589 [Morchella sextelata]KAH0604921.1 hypothetical protein H6S33_006589 [Morchella sextelata]